MTLLTPVPAAIAAAITIPVLVVFYLLKLRRRPVRVSSTLLWDQAVRDLQANVPFRLLRPSVLLLLHLAILGLFLLAMARPVLDSPGGVPDRVVLLIDRSASMGAVMGGRTRLSEAVERAADLVENSLRGNAELCVVAFAAEPRALTGFTRDGAALREALEAIQPADQPADLPGALALASALCAEGTGEDAARQGAMAVLFSDGSFASDGPLTVAGVEFRFVRSGPPESQAVSIDNVGIVAVAGRRDYEDPGLVRVFARVANAGASPLTVTVSLSVDGEAAESRLVELPARTPEGPGEAAVTLSARTTSAGVAVISIGRSDQLSADDAAALVLDSIARPRIVLVIPDAAPGGPPPGEGPEWLVADVLRELRPRSFRVVERSVHEAGETDADLVVFDRVTPARTPPVPSLSFGAGLPAVGVRLGETGSRGTYVLSWERAHPVLRQVSLDAVYVSSPLPVAVETGAETRITELARGTGGPLLLLAERDGVRRLIAAFAIADSNWPLTVGFTVFLAQAVDYLTMRGGEEGAAGTFTTTQAADVPVPPGAARVRVSGPRDFEVEVPAGRARAMLGVLERAGVYRATPLPGDTAIPVAVNLLDPTETLLATRDRVRVSGQTVESTGDSAGPREAWPWLVMAALVLLTLEWFLYAWRMRV